MFKKLIAFIWDTDLVDVDKAMANVAPTYTAKDIETMKALKAEFTGIIKSEIRQVIFQLDQPQEVKKALVQELGNSWHDNRFDFETIAYNLLNDHKRSTEERINKLWHDKTKLWTDTCVAAASHSSVPHKIADEVLASFEKTMETIKTNL